jgi:hypothetical protein
MGIFFRAGEFLEVVKDALSMLCIYLIK